MFGYNVESEKIEDILCEFAIEGWVTCRGCGLLLDLHTEKCPECKWKNPAVKVV